MKKLLPLFLCCLVLAGCRSQAGETTPQTTEQEKVTLTVYAPDDMAEGFVTSQAEVDAVTGDAIVEQLVLAQVLSEGTQVNELAVDDGTAGQRILHVDFTTPFRDRILSMGTAGEYGILGSVVNTFLTAYDAQSIVITVDGEPLETGHAVYDTPLNFFE